MCSVNCPADLQLSCSSGRTLSLIVELTVPESRLAIFPTDQILNNKKLFHITTGYSSIMLPLHAQAPVIPETIPE